MLEQFNQVIFTEFYATMVLLNVAINEKLYVF